MHPPWAGRACGMAPFPRAFPAVLCLVTLISWSTNVRSLEVGGVPYHWVSSPAASHWLWHHLLGSPPRFPWTPSLGCAVYLIHQLISRMFPRPRAPLLQLAVAGRRPPPPRANALSLQGTAQFAPGLQAPYSAQQQTLAAALELWGVQSTKRWAAAVGRVGEKAAAAAALLLPLLPPAQHVFAGPVGHHCVCVCKPAACRPSGPPQSCAFQGKDNFFFLK